MKITEQPTIDLTPRRPSRVWRAVKWLLLLLVLAALTFAVAGFVAYRAANAGRDALEQAADAAATLDVDGAVAQADEAGTQFRRAGRALVVLTPLRPIPTVGDRLAEGRAALSAAGGAIDALVVALQPVADAFAIARAAQSTQVGIVGVVPDGRTIFKDMTVEQKHRLLAAVAEAAPKLTAALPAIDEANRALAEVRLDDIGAPFNVSFASLRAKLAEAREQLTKARAGIAELAPFARVAPGLLGYPDARHYVIFLANNTELRPAGGFLGVVGAATVADAELTSLSLRDVYAYDGTVLETVRPPIPVPMTKFIGEPRWFLRDANWSPDFLESGRVMEQFFREEAKALPVGDGNVPRIDGMVMFTPELAVDILRLTGPITVDGITFTPENLVEELEFQVEVEIYNKEDYDPSNRKQAVADLAFEVIKRLEQMSFGELAEVAKIVEENFAESHIVLRLADTAAQQLALQRDWAGAMRPVYVDYLSVVDANLGALKTDAAMTRSVAYSVRPDGSGGFDGTAVLTYTNNGSFDYKTTRYQTYTRVYVPAGSELLGVEGAIPNTVPQSGIGRFAEADIYDELGRTAFGAYLVVEPGATRSLTFHYKLPSRVRQAVAAGVYRLDVEKQIGVGGAPALEIDVEVGNGVPDYKWTGDLRTDKVVLVKK
jgi:hypothetical protein